MSVEELAESLIKEFEGCSLTAYPDPLSGAAPYTVGYGSTRDQSGKPFKRGQKITQEQANLLLAREVDGLVAELKDSVPFWSEMAPEQQAALVSFAYNLGAGFMTASAGFETIQRLLRQKKWAEVPAALLLYRNPGSSVEEGLRRRRHAEGALWSKGLSNPSSHNMKITALKDTWLKKGLQQASALSDDQKKLVPAGKTYQLVSCKEPPGNRSHKQVELAYGAGVWFIYAPDWEPWGKIDAGFQPVSNNIRDFSAKVSRYFTWGEVWQYDTTRITDDPKILSNIRALAPRLDELRERFGPIGVTSWYRDPKTNAVVGGVPNSQHLQGWAADIYAISEDGAVFEQWLVDHWDGGVGKGIASGKGFTHVDLGPKRVWWY